MVGTHAAVSAAFHPVAIRMPMPKHQVKEKQAYTDLDHIAEVTFGDGGGKAAATEGQEDRGPADYEIRLDDNKEGKRGDDRK